MNESNVARLKRHPGLLVAFVSLLSAISPLTTDMYVNAIPSVARGWHVEVSTAYLSLILWLVSFSVGLLVCGIISDKIGRRPVALAGIAGFTLAALLCAFSSNIVALIGFRILQGFCVAACSSMALAITRDCFGGRERQRAMAWMGVFTLTAPIIAPFVGTAILINTSWQYIFGAQTLLGIGTCLWLWFFFRESIPHKETGTLGEMFQAYVRLARNRNFVISVLPLGVSLAPLFGFIGFATIIYLQIYKVDMVTYSALFALNGLSLSGGALLTTRLISRFRDTRLIQAALCCGVVAGTLMLAFGDRAVWLFAAIMSLYSLSFGVIRALANNLVIGQVDRDIGTASSVIVFLQYLLGAAMIAIESANWKQPFWVFAGLMLGISVTITLIWWRIKHRFEPQPEQPRAKP